MKKYIVSILITSMFLIGTPFIVPKASASDISIRDFIQLLVFIGVIGPEKIPAVNVYLSIMNGINTTPISVTSTSSIILGTQGTPISVPIAGASSTVITYVDENNGIISTSTPIDIDNGIISTSTPIIPLRPITLIYPAGGERWPLTSIQEIRWFSNHPQPTVNISLIDARICMTLGCQSKTYQIKFGANNTGSYHWTVGIQGTPAVYPNTGLAEQIPAGLYFLRICEGQDCSQSSNYITIFNPSI